VLAITAHPDDVDFAAAGTVARWTDAGIEVIYCLVTDGIGHPDHRAVGSAALDAVYPDARNPFAFPELRERESLAAWTVREVWIAGGPDPNHYVDVTETFPRKLAALRAHESQTGHMADLAERMTARLTRMARLGGLPGGRLAEGFRVLDTA
jgi:LmbE family N-acetylglucosaminyl deacetylase